jgi:hypothetical protein
MSRRAKNDRKCCSRHQLCGAGTCSAVAAPPTSLTAPANSSSRVHSSCTRSVRHWAVGNCICAGAPPLRARPCCCAPYHLICGVGGGVGGGRSGSDAGCAGGHASPGTSKVGIADRALTAAYRRHECTRTQRSKRSKVRSAAGGTIARRLMRACAAYLDAPAPALP